MKKSEIKKFARRFSGEDWGWLCTKSEFLNAVETKSEPEAEVVAHILLQSKPFAEPFRV